MPNSSQLVRAHSDPYDPLSRPSWMPAYPDWRTGYHYFRSNKKVSSKANVTGKASAEGAVPSGKDPKSTVWLLPPEGLPRPRRISAADAQRYTKLVVRKQKQPAKSSFDCLPPPVSASVSTRKQSPRSQEISAGRSSSTGRSSRKTSSVPKALDDRQVRFSGQSEEEKRQWLEEKHGALPSGILKLRERRPTPPASSSNRVTKPIVTRPPLRLSPVSGPYPEHIDFIHQPQAIELAGPEPDAAVFTDRCQRAKWRKRSSLEGFPCTHYAHHYDRIQPKDRIYRLPSPSNPRPDEDNTTQDAMQKADRGFFLFRESNFRLQNNRLQAVNLSRWRNEPRRQVSLVTNVDM